MTLQCYDTLQAQEEQKAKESFSGFPGGMPGGDMPGGASGLGDIFKDPEILAAMQVGQIKIIPL